MDGSTNFYRNWAAYKNGFGSLQNEHWLGNDNLHTLTSNGATELWIEMTNFAGVTVDARYTTFKVDTQATDYNLTIAGFSGNVGDSLLYHNGGGFTTYDNDNDQGTGNCAVQYLGAWWYKTCHFSNLNGKYYHGHATPYARGVVWYAFTGYYDSFS